VPCHHYLQAQRAGNAEAEWQRRVAAAATAAAEAAAAEQAAAAAAAEAEAAAHAAKVQRAQAMRGGEKRRRPRATRSIEEEGVATESTMESHGTSSADQLRDLVAANDWIGAARVAVAMAIETSMQPASVELLPPPPPPVERSQLPPPSAGERSALSSPSEEERPRLPPSPPLWHHEFGVGWVEAGSCAPVDGSSSRVRSTPPAEHARGMKAGAGFGDAGGSAEMTPRRLRAAMLVRPAADLRQDSFETLVDKAAARQAAHAALREPEDVSGSLAFRGVAAEAVERATRRADRKRDGVVTNMANPRPGAAQLGATTMSSAATGAPASGGKPRRSSHRGHGGSVAASSLPPHTSAPAAASNMFQPAVPFDLKAVEAAERRAFAKHEPHAIAAAAEARERGERILGYVHELAEPRVVRDFDSEISQLLAHATGCGGQRGSERFDRS